MGSELFDVVFCGHIREGADPEKVKARLGEMFRTDSKRLERLFSGKRFVIKRDVDEARRKSIKMLCERLAPSARSGPFPKRLFSPPPDQPRHHQLPGSSLPGVSVAQEVRRRSQAHGASGCTSRAQSHKPRQHGNSWSA